MNPETYRLPRSAVLLVASASVLGVWGAMPSGAASAVVSRDQVEASRITVLPVFIVPAGARVPEEAEINLLQRHLEMAQARYAELLGHRDTFLLEEAPLIHRSSLPLSAFRAAPEGGAPLFTSEVLAREGVDRFSARHVYVMVVMNPRNDFPVGGGRPLNGGLGTGGGVVVLSSFALNRSPNFQSTLQHELGHAFGLTHSVNYGEDMGTGRSIMSYNRAHHTRGLEPSETPGIFLPVELAALALNRRVFPALAGEATVEIPPAEPESFDLAWIPPMIIPDQRPLSVTVTTESGETYGSAAAHVVQGRIRPNAGPDITFDPRTMWHSAESPDGWVALDLTFPEPVTLTGVGIHTGHSGAYHQAREARLEIMEERDYWEVAGAPTPKADCLLELGAETGAQWRLWLRAGTSGMVVARGLEFRGEGGEDIYPPMVREVPPAREPCGG